MTHPSLARRSAAEALGSAFLLAAVIGSGIMGERLAGGNIAIALLANAVATGAGLTALILAFVSISGAHFNPAISLVSALRGDSTWIEVCAYVPAQIAGAFAGAALAHLMFNEPLFAVAQHARATPGQWYSEFVATFGLVIVIYGCMRARPNAVPFAVGAYITSAYWFTASTSFANPAVTLARTMTDTFAGIRPQDALGFIAAQLLGGGAAALTLTWLTATVPRPIAKRACTSRHEAERPPR